MFKLINLAVADIFVAKRGFVADYLWTIDIPPKFGFNFFKFKTRFKKVDSC